LTTNPTVAQIWLYFEVIINSKSN